MREMLTGAIEPEMARSVKLAERASKFLGSFRGDTVRVCRPIAPKLSLGSHDGAPLWLWEGFCEPAAFHRRCRVV